MLKILLNGTERFIKGVDHTNKLKEPNPRYPSFCAKYSAALFITLLLISSPYEGPSSVETKQGWYIKLGGRGLECYQVEKTFSPVLFGVLIDQFWSIKIHSKPRNKVLILTYQNWPIPFINLIQSNGQEGKLLICITWIIIPELILHILPFYFLFTRCKITGPKKRIKQQKVKTRI